MVRPTLSYWFAPKYWACAGATERPGSWWNDWAAWLEPFKGASRPAPAALGDAANPPIEPAPGRYVKMKAKPEGALPHPFKHPS